MDNSWMLLQIKKDDAGVWVKIPDALLTGFDITGGDKLKIPMRLVREIEALEQIGRLIDCKGIIVSEEADIVPAQYASFSQKLK
jgi:hypothetical protein